MIRRRDLLAAAGGIVGGGPLRSRANVSGVGPCEPLGTASQAPTEKVLPATRVDALSQRGEATVYRDKDFKFIGMPVGGLTTGQLYLGGDGRLWYWDIFNQTKPAEQPGAGHYASPLSSGYFSAVEQGFNLNLEAPDSEKPRPLSVDGFSEVSFRGQYPLGTVEYRDPGCPLAVTLEAFSPFTPLNVAASSIPATLLRFTLKNIATRQVRGELTGFLENAVARAAYPLATIKRDIKVERYSNFILLNCSASVSPALELPDAGTMGLALLAVLPSDSGVAKLPGRSEQRPAGSLTRRLALEPGASQVVMFAVVWCFPNLLMDWSLGGPPLERLALKGNTRRHYANRFDSAVSVARYVADGGEALYSRTRLWCDTWYESTLPHWLLERTFINTSTLATSTAFRFADGRFYGSEGVGGGPGTCTHVWYYEQAMGRLFPELDVLLRERTDFNPAISFKPDGLISQRGELYPDGATDGQAGTILRALRNHQTSPDDAFLKRNWAAIAKATQWLIAQDGNRDGIFAGGQINTLDAEWFGPVAWLSGLYLAALRAAEELALDAGDTAFATTCRGIFTVGQKNFVDRLFNGEYFINLPDPKHPEAINSGSGCLIDQVLGQSWAFQLGLGRVLPAKQTRAALSALWRYNFKTDVGPYRDANRGGRWLAMPGEGGLLMCTFPRPDWDFQQARGQNRAENGGYFNECMTGFEHQVAAHMIWEGMVTEGLAIERAIHDRYHASRRNPWNEVEAGDHYARAMASYGVHIAVCGFEYHGPKGYMAFAPRVTPENFQAAFTAAEGWGRFRQHSDRGQLSAGLDLEYGRLRLRSLRLTPVSDGVPVRSSVTVNNKAAQVKLNIREGHAYLAFASDVELRAGDRMEVMLSP